MIRLLKSLLGIGPKTDYRQLLSEGALILDVRTPEEFNAGHLEQAVNIPLNLLPQQLNNLKLKGKPIITICRSGSRSAMAKSMLKRHGMAAYNGGAWTSFKHKIS